MEVPKMNCEKYESYLVSLGEVITEYALEAKKKSISTANTDGKDFADGYLSGFYRIVTLMQQHAEAYDITMQELGMENLKETDLM